MDAPANYASSLIEALRSANPDDLSGNTGFTKYANPKAKTSAAKPSLAPRVLGPQLLTVTNQTYAPRVMGPVYNEGTGDLLGDEMSVSVPKTIDNIDPNQYLFGENLSTPVVDDLGSSDGFLGDGVNTDGSVDPIDDQTPGPDDSLDPNVDDWIDPDNTDDPVIDDNSDNSDNSEGNDSVFDPGDDVIPDLPELPDVPEDPAPPVDPEPPVDPDDEPPVEPDQPPLEPIDTWDWTDLVDDGTVPVTPEPPPEPDTPPAVEPPAPPIEPSDPPVEPPVEPPPEPPVEPSVEPPEPPVEPSIDPEVDPSVEPNVDDWIDPTMWVDSQPSVGGDDQKDSTQTKDSDFADGTFNGVNPVNRYGTDGYSDPTISPFDFQSDEKSSPDDGLVDAVAVAGSLGIDPGQAEQLGITEDTKVQTAPVDAPIYDPIIDLLVVPPEVLEMPSESFGLDDLLGLEGLV